MVKQLIVTTLIISVVGREEGRNDCRGGVFKRGFFRKKNEYKLQNVFNNAGMNVKCHRPVDEGRKKNKQKKSRGREREREIKAKSYK